MSIAYMLGFEDEKYFMKLFKEYENLTPSTYRNTYYRTLYNNEWGQKHPVLGPYRKQREAFLPLEFELSA